MLALSQPASQEKRAESRFRDSYSGDRPHHGIGENVGRLAGSTVAHRLLQQRAAQIPGSTCGFRHSSPLLVGTDNLGRSGPCAGTVGLFSVTAAAILSNSGLPRANASSMGNVTGHCGGFTRDLLLQRLKPEIRRVVVQNDRRERMGNPGLNTQRRRIPRRCCGPAHG